MDDSPGGEAVVEQAMWRRLPEILRYRHAWCERFPLLGEQATMHPKLNRSRSGTDYRVTTTPPATEKEGVAERGGSPVAGHSPLQKERDLSESRTSSSTIYETEGMPFGIVGKSPDTVESPGVWSRTRRIKQQTLAQKDFYG
jgi:hypothetical protein